MVARAFLRAALQTWALDGFGEVTEVLTTELVSNVVRHAGGPMTLRARLQPTSIRVEVDDTSSERPVLRNRGQLAEHGRGLQLLDALASKWGVTDLGDDGKTVWFELEVPRGTTGGERSLP
jgi:anti-sigma regulatory factor (Ser/Thr protein kinase)